MRARSIVAVAALVVAAPAAAQQHPMPGPAMQQCMDMMGGPPAAVLLEHVEALGLTADQVSRLEVIRDQTQAAAREHMQPVRAAHMSAAELLRADSPDLDEYEDALEEAAEHMVAAHVAVVRASLAAREVLTAEQRSTLQTMRPLHAMPHGDSAAMPRMDRMPADTAPRAGMQAMQGAGMDDMHHMMMMHCMMGADAHGGAHHD